MGNVVRQNLVIPPNRRADLFERYPDAVRLDGVAVFWCPDAHALILEAPGDIRDFLVMGTPLNSLPEIDISTFEQLINTGNLK